MFRAQPIASSIVPRHVPTFGGTFVRLKLAQPVRGLDNASLQSLKCEVKLVQVSDFKATMEVLLEARLTTAAAAAAVVNPTASASASVVGGGGGGGGGANKGGGGGAPLAYGEGLDTITFTAPPWPTADEVAVYVTFNGGDDFVATTVAIAYFTQPNELAELSPTCGPESGGTQLDLYIKGSPAAAKEAGGGGAGHHGGGGGGRETGEIVVFFHSIPCDISALGDAAALGVGGGGGPGGAPRRRSLFQESRQALTAKQTFIVAVPGRYHVHHGQGRIRCRLPPHTRDHVMSVQVTVALNGVDCIGVDPRHTSTAQPSAQSMLTFTYYRTPTLARMWPQILPTDGSGVLLLRGEFPSIAGVETVKVLVKQPGTGRAVTLDGKLELSPDRTSSEITCRVPKMPAGDTFVEVSAIRKVLQWYLQ